MNNVGDLLFALVCIGFLLHEMDAVQEREWTLLYGLRRLRSDARARTFFIWLHLPLLIAILFLVAHENHAVASSSRTALEAFAILHAGLHARIRARGSEAFASVSSRLIIHGTAVVGGFALLLRALN